MSPLLPDELRVVLYPDHAVLVRLGRTLSLRGTKHVLRSKQIVSRVDDVQGDSSWDGVIDGLESQLPAEAKKAHATVILSNHFVHYVLVPWSDSLSGEGEEIAFARHCFKSAFGEPADRWDLRLSPAPLGSAQVASAVDGRLLQALQTLFDHAGIALRSVQPHLMAAFNACRRSLQGRSAWFVVCEPGSLCLMLLQRGGWGALKTVRVEDDWQEELPLILEREACLVEANTDTDDVLLWAPGTDIVELAPTGRWKFKNLRLPVRSDFAPDGDARFDLALGTASS